MKKKIISLMIAVLAAGAFVSCSDWTEPEARDFTQHKPASYYELSLIHIYEPTRPY